MKVKILFMSMVIIPVLLMTVHNQSVTVVHETQREELKIPQSVEKPTENKIEYTEEIIITDIEPEYTEEEIELLAKTVFAEANTEDLYGQQLVCRVILNRVNSPKFPDTIYEVISQKNPRQFTTYWNGAIKRATPTDTNYQAVRNELDNPSDLNILFFRAGHYHEGLPQAYKHGAHYFSYAR